MARIEAEYLRTNVTVGQFLSYVRANLRKRGLNEWANGIDYENFINGDWSCKVDHEELNDEAFTQLGVAYEEVRDLPYNKMSYQRKANGAVSNEIMEFVFDDESTGHGYYYAVDCVDEADSVESTADTAESEQEDNAVLTEEAADEPVAGAASAGEPVTLDAIAREFSRQQKYYDEHWARSHRDSTDSIVEFHYRWRDSDDAEYRDWVSILLSDACSAAGVNFDVVEDEDDLEERVRAELVEQGYKLDDDGDPVDEDGERAYEDIRRGIWRSALDERDRARDELCSHEDIGEPWFRELVEEMYARAKASVEEYEI